MAIETRGFQLSALPKAPAIPQNIGVLDMKSIHDGVRRGLETFEAVRRAPQSMILADAQMKAQTAAAPLQTRQLLAETAGVEQQTPLRTSLLAAEASPEMQEAKRQALLARAQPRSPSGDIQMATALANARLRLSEDPNDAAAQQLVATLEPMVLKKSAVSAADPAGVIQAGLERNALTNTTRETIAGANREALDTRSELQRGQSQTNAQITADSRVNAARAQFAGKIYETAAQKNEKVQTDILALKALDQKVDAYKNSALGSGIFVGSGPALAVRSVFGDNTGKELAAATALSMGSAVETMRGLGAMSEREFNAAMAQLPLPNDPAEVLDTKMGYIRSVRQWMAARNNAFLERIEAGDSPMKAHEFVRKSLPMVLPDGNIADPVVIAAPPADAPSTVVTPLAAPAGTPAPSRFRIIEVK
jgi:hypothetical protein